MRRVGAGAGIIGADVTEEQAMQLPEFSIAGQTAIITGASQGLGRGIALTYADGGADVCLVARNQAKLEEVAAEVRAKGCKALVVQCDITKSNEVERLAEATFKEFGRVDILVNNAGAAYFKPLLPLPGFNPATAVAIPGFAHPTSDEEWFTVLNTNVTGPFYLMRAIVPRMMAQGGGKVLNMSSVDAFKAPRFRASYSGSKAALSMLTKSLAVEWARYKINVNAIAGGYLETEMTASLRADPRMRERALAEIPARRFGTDRDVGLLAAFLVSPAAAWITGQTIILDGGMLA